MKSDWRWLLLSLMGIGAGALCLWLQSENRSGDVGGALVMELLAAWFIYYDIRVDEMLERDAKKAERERRDWMSYS